MKARVVSPDPAHLAEAAELLREGKVVGMPTETVYGLAGHALDPNALARIFATKERPTFDPLIVHIPRELSTLDALARAGLIELSRLTKEARSTAELLIAGLWPGPLTLILPKTTRVPDLATSGLDTVAIRMPAHPVAQALLAETGFPLAAPSANRFGRISPTTASAVLEELGDRIELILDGGRCEVGVESTVVALKDDGSVRILRPGGVTAQKLEALVGRRIADPAEAPLGSSGSTAARARLAPGLLDSHYAPSTPLAILPARARALANLAGGAQPPSAAAPIGLLAFAGGADEGARDLARALGEAAGLRRIFVRVLSPSGDLTEAARNLFASLRELDASGATLIYAEPCPSDDGLGHAIKDRLARAAAPRSEKKP